VISGIITSGEIKKQQVYERVQNIASDLDIALDPMAETALRYVLSNNAVCTVIAGMWSLRNVERNCQVGEGAACQEKRLRN
jgi:predicted aldo/keto reductase-like oxidoreductase